MPSENRHLPPFFSSFLTVFSVFFVALFQKCANWGEISPKSAGFEPLLIVNPFAVVSNRSKGILARKWRSTSALLKCAKKVGRRKGTQANGLGSRAGLQSMGEWRFWASKKRHWTKRLRRGLGGAASVTCADREQREPGEF
jgi:hypothetical protein